MSLLKKKIDVETIDHTKEKFFLCSRPYKFAKYKENGDEVNSKCNIPLISSEGYFAALNDNDTSEYLNVEVLGEESAIGFVIENMPTGVYGRFYEDFDYKTDNAMKIKPYADIKDGNAEVWIPKSSLFEYPFC